MKKTAILAAGLRGRPPGAPTGMGGAGRPRALPFSLDGRWKYRPGCAFGVGQASLHGRVLVPERPDVDMRALREWMRDVCRLPALETASGAGSARVLAESLGHWAVAIQRRAGIEIGSGFEVRPQATAEGAPPGVRAFELVLPCAQPVASHLALEWVQRVVSTFFMRGASRSIAQLRRELDAIDEKLAPMAAPGQNRAYIVQHVLDAGVPVTRVVRGIYRLGCGRRARLLDSSITDRTPSIGVSLAGDKVRTATVLRQAGLPGAVHQLARDVDDAVRIASQFGYPVVVKPADQEQGRGVAADLRSPERVRDAFEAARAVSARVLVERHFDGVGHRLALFEGQLYKVTRKMPGGVTGDGTSRIDELVERGLQARRKAILEGGPERPPVVLDDEALGMLEQRGLSAGSVLPEGVFVPLRRRNNATAGGTTETLDPAAVHPDNLALALRAARLLGLDWAGVDLLIPDIGTSWFESGALICEVNAQPQADRKTVARIVDELLRDGCRIPVHLAVCAAPGGPQPGELERLAGSLGCNGFSSTAGVWIDGGRATLPMADGLRAGRALLDSPEVEAALCAMTPSDILEHGLPVDRFDSVHVLGEPGSDAAGREALRAAMALAAPHLPSGRAAP